MINAAVLISVYKREKPAFLDECFQSIYNQSIQAEQILLVKDGPLNKKLDEVINKWNNLFVKCGVDFKIISLKENQGLGKALNVGISACNKKYIIRMDSDDVCCTNRFSDLKNFIDSNIEFDVVGALIEEFDSESGVSLGARVVKSEYEEIIKDLKRRNPMNHVTVLYKSDSIKKIGGYSHFLSFEDYHLWARMIKHGMILKNIPEIHVQVRAGIEMLGRRRGKFYMRQEFKMQKFLLKQKQITKLEFFQNILIRCGGRIMPTIFLKYAYKNFRVQL